MAEADIPLQDSLSKGSSPVHPPSYEEQLASVESMMTCYDTPLTQAAGYTRDLLRTIIYLQTSRAPKNFRALIQELEAKWKPSAIQVGSPLVRLDEVLEVIRSHRASEVPWLKDGDDLKALGEALHYWINMEDDDVEDLEKISPFMLHRVKRLAFYARRFLEEANKPISAPLLGSGSL